jgi:receptor protein-tyrosine kinase
MELGDFLAVAMRRWLLVLVSAVLSAGAAWVTLSDDPPVYERTLRYVVHPDQSFARGDVPNAIENLEQEGPLMQTILGVLDSGSTLERAVDVALVGKAGEEINLTASIRPGSNVIDCTLRGPNRRVLSAVGDSLTIVASAYVTQTYKGYDLDYLGVEAPLNPLPRAAQSASLAALIGALLGIGVIFFEALTKSRNATSARAEEQPAVQREPPPPPPEMPPPWDTLRGTPRPPVRMGNGARGAERREPPHVPRETSSQ